MSDQLKEWMGAGEIARLSIIGLPRTVGGIHSYARRHGFHLDPSLCRKTPGLAGRGVQYHRDILPKDYLTAPQTADVSESDLWLNANEIFRMKFPGLPASRGKLYRYLERFQGIADLCRPKMDGKGGFQYRISAIREDARERATRLKRHTPGLLPAYQLERGSIVRLPELFPAATKITIDLHRPAGRRVLVRVKAVVRHHIEHQKIEV